MEIPEDFWKYLALILLCVMVLFVINKSFGFQRNIVEGLTNKEGTNTYTQPEKIVDHVRANNEEMENQILVDKYRSNYEDLLIQHNHNINLQILKNYIDHAKDLSIGNENGREVLNHIQQLNAQKQILNNTMDWMDGTTKNIFS